MADRAEEPVVTCYRGDAHRMRIQRVERGGQEQRRQRRGQGDEQNGETYLGGREARSSR